MFIGGRPPGGYGGAKGKGVQEGVCLTLDCRSNLSSLVYSLLDRLLREL